MCNASQQKEKLYLRELNIKCRYNVEKMRERERGKEISFVSAFDQ